MKVRWHLPESPVLETTVPDVEQLQFLLRLVRRVRIRKRTYRWKHSELVVEEDHLYLSIYVDEEDRKET